MGRTPLAAISALVVLLAGSAAAQTAADEIPRTFEGRPDFGGAWVSPGLTMMERPAPGPLVVDDEQAAIAAQEIYDFLRSPEMEVEIDPEALASNIGALGKVGGEWRTSFVTLPEDGKLPFTDEAGRRQEDFRERYGRLDGPETRDMFERCLMGKGEAPLTQVPSNNVRRIVQTPDHVLVYTEEGGDLRTIRVNAMPAPGNGFSIYGDSLAHWDGDALVVETKGAVARVSEFPWSRIVVGEHSVIRERMELIAPDELLYRFTVEDEELYSAPWSAEYSMYRSDMQTYEYSCHEGNYSIVNILKAARIADQQ